MNNFTENVYTQIFIDLKEDGFFDRILKRKRGIEEKDQKIIYKTLTLPNNEDFYKRAINFLIQTFGKEESLPYIKKLMGGEND